MFDFLRKDRVVDLSAGYNARREAKSPEKNIRQNSNSQTILPDKTPAIFDGGKTEKTNSEGFEEGSPNESAEERRKKLANRLVNITERLDILSTQIYHLQQRVELLEKKFNIGS